MSRLTALGRTPRLVAAALAAGVTWAVFGSVVSLGAEDHDRLVAAIESRQPTAAAIAPRGGDNAQPQLLAASFAP
jgi:hypothetical protein